MSDPRYERITTSETNPERKRRRRKGYLILAAILAGILLLVAIGSQIAQRTGGDGTHDAPYSSGQANVAVIEVTGTIAEANESYNQEWLNHTIDNARYDKDNQGIALVIDSPGGSVYQSDETYLRLKQYREETNRPVYAYMESMAASGGYYIAAAADEITANRNTLTGSIGVIGFQSIDLTAFLERMGIQMEAVHSGDNKLMGAFYEPVTEEQRAIMQSISDEYYNQFVGIVAEGREMDEAAVRELADGRIYTASQALDNGLIDAVFTSYEEFEAHMREKLSLEDNVSFKKRSYESPRSIWSGLVSAEALRLLQRSGQDEFTAVLETMERLQTGEPMYLYEPALLSAAH